MRTVSVKGFISYNAKPWASGEKFSFDSFKMETDGYVNVGPCTVEIQVPENFDPRKKQTEQLQAEKQKAMADFQALVTSIDRKISELTCLEMS